jgi:hypothetical protein
VEDFRWTGDWLVGVTINGESFSVRQPLAHDSIRRGLLGFVMVLAVARLGRMLSGRASWG